MLDYFDKISSHVHGQMDIDAITTERLQTKVITLGSDDLIKWRNLHNNENDEFELSTEHGFNKIAMHPSGKKFIVGGHSKKVIQYSMETKSMTKVICETLGRILDLKYSPSGRYISIASEETKTIVVDTENNRKTKCRPGHNNHVLNTFFGNTDRYAVSIGEDCIVLIYQIFPDKDPLEVYKTKFTEQKPPEGVQGCFASLKEGLRVFVPGTKELQIIEPCNNSWQIKNSNINHKQPIILAQVINSQLLATSCPKEFCIWQISTQEKRIVLEDLIDSPIIKVIPIRNTFIANRNDGCFYIYNRSFPKSSNKQQVIEAEQNSNKNYLGHYQENSSRINFQQNGVEQQHDQEVQEEQEEEQVQEYVQRSAKKRIADKIIKVFPQNQIIRATSFFQDHRFLYTNMHGCIFEVMEADEYSIYAQFKRADEKNPAHKLLFKNKQLRYFGMNKEAVCYANETQFGIKIDKFSSWEKEWYDIQGVALSGNWMAVANTSEIRFYDIAGNQIKSICFDRPIIAMEGYENLLAVVYHEGVPIYESQLLGMKIFTVNQFEILNISYCHLPLTLPERGEKGSILRWFGFSLEGMIFTQDSFGILRAYSLQSNEWTPIIAQSVSDAKKAWIIGFKQYAMIYWRITDSEPEPTVRPRLNEKISKLSIPTLVQGIQQLQHFPHILWQRYCLDHELARWRLWSRHKDIRHQKHINYDLSKTIINEKAIGDKHLSLDVELYPIIKYFLKTEQTQRALNFVKSQIKSIEAGRNLTDLFDQCGYRNLAIDLEYFFDEKSKQIKYEIIQQLALKQLKTQVQVSLHQKRDNPMNPKFKKSNNMIPYNISSQPSQNSSIMEDITHKSQQNSRVEQVFENPFLKKKSTDDRKQQIQEHIQKYGVKRKAEEKKKNKL